MKGFLSKIVAFLILVIFTVGFSSTIISAFAHDPSDAYEAGYERGYQHGYQHGYQDAVTGLGYENVADSHGAEAYGPYGEGMHEGEHVGYEAGFRTGSGRHHHHRYPGSSRVSSGMMISVDAQCNQLLTRHPREQR